MVNLFIRHNDGSEKVLNNIKNVWRENEKLFITSDSGETSLDDVKSFKFEHQYNPLSFLYDNEITED